jgi:geranylgeranyl diphosphate synthase type I
VTTAPPQLVEVAGRVDARLAQLLGDETRRWTSIDPRLAELVDELARMVLGGGKRLRAGFCYWTWKALADVNPDLGSGAGLPVGSDDGAEPVTEADVINIGAAFELLQTFALIHDDIMDDSSTRRGLPTIHTVHRDRMTERGWRGEPRRYGDGVAILVGDLGHVYADQLVGRLNGPVRDLWDELRIELNLGQYLDMRSAATGAHELDTARRVATFKSALYTIVRPVQIGAALRCWPAGPGDDLLDGLDRFARPLGLAFQLRDDNLGVLGDPDNVGKPVGDDLREGKPTELVAWAHSKATESQAAVLNRIGRPDLGDDEVADIVEVLVDTGAVERCESEILRLLEESAAELRSLPLTAEGRDALSALAEFTARRSH